MRVRVRRVRDVRAWVAVRVVRDVRVRRIDFVGLPISTRSVELSLLLLLLRGVRRGGDLIFGCGGQNMLYFLKLSEGE